MKRLAAGLALGLVVDPSAFSGGLWHWLFPFAFLYLLLEGTESDTTAFLKGAAFAFVYNGAYTKAMQNGFNLSGLSWRGILAAPLEWGMVSVLWLHLVDALVPRREPAPWWKPLAAAVIAACAAGVYVTRLAFDHYPGEKLLGAFWLLYDALFLAAGALLWRAGGAAIWPVCFAGVWALGAEFIALPFMPVPLYYTLELAWAVLLGIAAWNTWRDRHVFDDTPRRKDRLALYAVALHALSSFLGPFWLSLPLDLAAKLVFSYSFLTRRLKV